MEDGKLRRICVFCGSSPGERAEYAAAARELARELVARNLELVFGGGKVGIMGIIADAVLEQGGHVIGVIPRALAKKEVAHDGLPDLRVVANMHERKALMAELSDAFISLPGGIGTLEECFETLTWAQLGMHEKPCGLLDVCGYYTHLVEFLHQAVRERFLRDVHLSMLLVDQNAGPLLDACQRYRAPGVDKWIDRSQS